MHIGGAFSLYSIEDIMRGSAVVGMTDFPQVCADRHTLMRY
jgi:hypothetical protein